VSNITNPSLPGLARPNNQRGGMLLRIRPPQTGPQGIPEEPTVSDARAVMTP
jgi:hypothetical protein